MTFVPKQIYFKVSESKKKAGIYCAAYNCRNKPCAKKRGLCHTHYHRWRRIIDPIYNRYTDFRKNALRRNKEFTITLEQFRVWCKQNGYLEKGRRGYAATIDRIKNKYGYHIWNIQIKTMKSNIKKYHEVDKYESSDYNQENNDYIPF